MFQQEFPHSLPPRDAKPAADERASGDGLAKRFGLDADPDLDDLLDGLSAAVYSGYSPDDSPVAMQGWRPQLAESLRQIVTAANTIRDTVLSNFAGGVELAVVDLYGLDALPIVMRAIHDLHLLPERDTPVEASPALASLTVRVLSEQWRLQGGQNDPDLFLAFVNAALRGRCRFAPGMIEGAVAEIMWTYRNGVERRPPLD